MLKSIQKLLVDSAKFEKMAQELEFGEEDLLTPMQHRPSSMPINNTAWDRMLSLISKNASDMQKQVDRFGGIEGALKAGHTETLLGQLREIASVIRVLERRLQ